MKNIEFRKRQERYNADCKNIASFEEALADEAVQTAGDEAPACFDGKKDNQIQQILYFLKENTPQWHMDLETYQSSKNIVTSMEIRARPIFFNRF